MSVAVSVAPAPLRPPRVDGVMTSTGNGPLSRWLPAPSIVRTSTSRRPIRSAVGTIGVLARSGHGLASRGVHVASRAPTSTGAAPVTSQSSTRRMPALSVALITTGSEPWRCPRASRPSAATVGDGGAGS